MDGRKRRVVFFTRYRVLQGAGLTVTGKQQSLFARYREQMILEQLKEDLDYAKEKLKEWEALDGRLKKLMAERAPASELYRFALSNDLLKRRVFTSGILMTAYHDREVTASRLKKLVTEEKERIREKLVTIGRRL